MFWISTDEKMKLLVLTLIAIASSSAIREEQNICFHIGGVEICGDSSISGKKNEKDKRIFHCYYINGVETCVPGITRDEDLNLAEIVASIEKVVQAMHGFVGGSSLTREEQDVAPCITSSSNIVYKMVC